MSEAPPDFKVLARRYLDLWQDQVTAMGNDPVLAEAVAKGIAMMTQVPTAFAQAAAAGKAVNPVKAGGASNDAPRESAHAAQASTSAEPAAPPGGAAPVAAAPDGPCLDLDGLQARLAALEERVAVLESRLAAAGGSPEDKPRRRRTRRLERL